MKISGSRLLNSPRFFTGVILASSLCEIALFHSQNAQTLSISIFITLILCSITYWIEGRRIRVSKDLTAQQAHSEAAENVRIRSELEEKTNVLEAVLNHIPSGVVVSDDTRRLIIKNKKLIDFFAVNETHKIGSLEAYHPEDLRPYELSELPIPTVLRTGKPVLREILVKSATGERRLFRFNSAPVFSNAGKLIAAVSVIDDIHDTRKNETERAQRLVEQRASVEIKKSHQLLETVLQNIPFMIFMKDAETLQYTYVNRTVVDTLKVPESALIGKRSGDLFSKEQAELVETTDRQLIKTGIAVDLPSHRVTIQTIGTRIYYTRKFLLDHGDGTKTIVNVSSDITEIIDARDAAQQVSRMKTQFLATMSHEIRTPLNGIIGMADLVLEGALNAEQKKFMDLLKDSGQALLSIVNDVLDFSKVEGGHIVMEKIDFPLREAFESHFQLLKYRAQAKDLQLSAEFDSKLSKHFRGDPNRISQIINNLVGNAIKFTDTGGVKVHFDCLDNSGSQTLIKVSVKDTGIGISEDERSILFRPFVQGDGSMARRYGGTGLGLSICKQLAKLMEGQIGVESKKNEGSCFWFTMKLDNVAESESKVSQPFDTGHLAVHGKNHVELSSAKILLAEDNPTNQILGQAILKRMGYDSHVVSNGREALEACQKHSYDLILMDCQMPELDGYEATIQIRELEKTTKKHIPIVALTANALPEDRDKCMSVGMDDFISKPIDRTLLAKVLKNLMAPAA